MNPLRVVVNADDLGASPTVNEAIFQEMDAGRVTSATILANGPAFEECLSGIRQYPHASFGVHLNLTEYEPLSCNPSLGQLTDSNGCMHFGLRYRRFSPSELLWVYREFSAQIRRLVQSGVRISHIDSHHHIHTRPDFLPLVKALQREFGIPRVRARLNLYPRSQPPRQSVRIAIPLYNAALRLPPATRTTDYMCALSVFVDRVTHRWRPRSDTAELMVHPGLDQPQYQSEMALLQTDWISSLPRASRTVTFWQI